MFIQNSKNPILSLYPNDNPPRHHPQAQSHWWSPIWTASALTKILNPELLEAPGCLTGKAIFLISGFSLTNTGPLCSAQRPAHLFFWCFLGFPPLLPSFLIFFFQYSQVFCSIPRAQNKCIPLQRTEFPWTSSHRGACLTHPTCLPGSRVLALRCPPNPWQKNGPFCC